MLGGRPIAVKARVDAPPMPRYARWHRRTNAAASADHIDGSADMACNVRVPDLGDLALEEAYRMAAQGNVLAAIDNDVFDG